jgi:hypothetical protein
MSENPIAVIEKEQFSLTPRSLSEAMEFAKIMSDSDLVPKDYRGKPGNVLVAIQMGQEVGLKPIQAVQNIAVINGRPAIWGDALLALCMPHIATIMENYDEESQTAYCSVTRKNGLEGHGQWSMEDAKRAGLAGRETWKSYPRRMCQMRARGFALRDAMPDVLKGITTAEEAQDAPPLDQHSVEIDGKPLERSGSAVQDLKSKLKQKAAPIAEDKTIIVNTDEGEVNTETGEVVGQQGQSDTLRAYLKMMKGVSTATGMDQFWKDNVKQMKKDLSVDEQNQFTDAFVIQKKDIVDAAKDQVEG